MDAAISRTVDVFLEGAKKPLLVILGPTASGKTALSIELAKYVDGEIVNGDSRQIYKHLDIGTAKITEEEMDGVLHHLIDELDPKEEITVAWFQDRATKVIDDILARKKMPILVGGSMLYLSAITDGLSLLPAADSDLHDRLVAEYKADGGERLYKRLQKIDPEIAANIHKNNMPRVIRAIEIYETLHESKSDVISRLGELRPRDPALSSSKGEQKKCSYDLLIFGVEQSTDALKKRINERTDAMIEAGWIEEVQELLRRGYTEADPGMKSHGYRQIMQYLSELEAGDVDPDAMKKALKENIAAKTRQYAKRQMTWWRGDNRIRWIRS